VRKEKWRDAGWKLLLLEKGIKYQLREKVLGKFITFYLVDISPPSMDIL